MTGTHRVYVVELDDESGPRRRADRPNLHVGITTMEPTEKLAQIERSSKRHRQIRSHVVRLRADLTRSYKATTELDARRQKRKLAIKLMRQGYTVNGDRRVWQLYVIELGGEPSSTNRALPRVYVGETSKSPEERLEQHLSGARNGKGRLYSSVVNRDGLRLRPDLVLLPAVHYTQEDSRRAEDNLATLLRERGYEVKGGH